MLSQQQNPYLIPIVYPDPDFKIEMIEGKPLILDRIRKKKIILTPEEWVRQNFIRYLIEVKKYPASLMAVEKEIRLNDRKKRCDIVIYRDALPWLIVECKEPQVLLDQKALEQILSYNMSLKVPYLILTNGKYTFGIQSNGHSWNYLTELPEYTKE